MHVARECEALGQKCCPSGAKREPPWRLQQSVLWARERPGVRVDTSVRKSLSCLETFERSRGSARLAASWPATVVHTSKALCALPRVRCPVPSRPGLLMAACGRRGVGDRMSLDTYVFPSK